MRRQLNPFHFTCKHRYRVLVGGRVYLRFQYNYNENLENRIAHLVEDSGASLATLPVQTTRLSPCECARNLLGPGYTKQSADVGRRRRAVLFPQRKSATCKGGNHACVSRDEDLSFVFRVADATGEFVDNGTTSYHR